MPTTKEILHQMRSATHVPTTRQQAIAHLTANGIPSEDLAENLYVWAEDAFNTKAIVFNSDKAYWLYIVEAILEIYVDDRFVITTCDACGDTLIVANLDIEEEDMFDTSDQPSTTNLERYCKDCQAALDLT